MAKTEHANLDIRVFDKGTPHGRCAIVSAHRLRRWSLGSTEHGYHRCARINHHGSVNSFFFDGPLGLWILNGFSAYQEYVTLCSSLSNEAG